MNKKTLSIIIVVIGLAVGFWWGKKTPQPVAGNPPAATYFAEIDKNGVVLRVIVATQAVIDSGIVGDPANWVQTYIDGSQKKNYAGKGYKYDKIQDYFIPVDPQISGETFDPINAKWVLPTL